MIHEDTRRARFSSCVFVDHFHYRGQDNPQADMAGAHQVGMQTVWRKGYLAWPEQLSIRPHHTIDELSQILAITF